MWLAPYGTNTIPVGYRNKCQTGCTHLRLHPLAAPVYRE